METSKFDEFEELLTNSPAFINLSSTVDEMAERLEKLRQRKFDKYETKPSVTEFNVALNIFHQKLLRHGMYG